MNFYEKLKGINKKWLYLLAVLVVLGIGGTIAGEVIGERIEQKIGKYNPALSRDVYLDLLYLENNEPTKINAEQAKELLPLVERVSKVSDSTQFTMVQNIYSLLTPQQYQALLNKDNNVVKPEGEKDTKRRGREQYDKRDQRIDGDYMESFDFKHEGQKYNNAKEAAIENVVIKMLKDKISGNNNQSQDNNQSTTNGVVYSSK